MQENHITVSRTARYFTLGELNKNTKSVWFVLHGYGQLADSFLKSFVSLDNGENYIVAPEGLSRFYWEGFGGKPVASWMTRVDRLNEIKDYLAYLDQFYKHILDGFDTSNLTINILGFSQGVATASRWLNTGTIPKVDNVIFFAGEIGREIDLTDGSVPLQRYKVIYIYGNKDPFITTEVVERYWKRLKDSKLNMTKLVFDGKHEVNETALEMLSETL